MKEVISWHTAISLVQFQLSNETIVDK